MGNLPLKKLKISQKSAKTAEKGNHIAYNRLQYVQENDHLPSQHSQFQTW
jgi:hypothetical protein